MFANPLGPHFASVDPRFFTGLWSICGRFDAMVGVGRIEFLMGLRGSNQSTTFDDEWSQILQRRNFREFGEARKLQHRCVLRRVRR